MPDSTTGALPSAACFNASLGMVRVSRTLLNRRKSASRARACWSINSNVWAMSGESRPRRGRARLIVFEQRGRRAVELATATLDEILSEWKVYLGTRNFTLLHQILDQLREITDPYAGKPPRRTVEPRFPFAPKPSGTPCQQASTPPWHSQFHGLIPSIILMTFWR